MSEAYQYAVWRVVPDAQRGECVNVAVVLYCPRLRFLGAEVDFSASRVSALTSKADLDAVSHALRQRASIATGDTSSVGALPASDRFGWLVAPASTIVQPGPVHTGLTNDPAATLSTLYARLVSAP